MFFFSLVRQIFSNLVRKDIQNFVEYVRAEPLMVKNMIGAYGNTDIALHGGAMLRECIRYKELAELTLYDETLWLFFDQVTFLTLMVVVGGGHGCFWCCISLLLMC